jgi:hypothetical protein
VTLSAAANFTAKQSVVGEKPLGVSQEWSRLTPLPGAATYAAADGNEVSVYSLGQVCYLTCGTASITRGAQLKPDALGKAQVAVSTNAYGALALESGVAGSLIRVVIREGVA